MKMSVKKHRTPLKSRTQSPTPNLLSDNDDDFERAQARAARAAARRRKSLLGTEDDNGRGKGSSSKIRDEDLLGKDQILELFQNCIKLASENKINQRNTWELSLIDHLSDLIKVEDEDTETNFQKASCTLEAGVKIYSLRVDSVHSEAYKVLGGINRTGTGDEDASEHIEGGDVGDECDTEKGSQMKIQSPLATLEPSFQALNVKKFDVAFTVDPLYHQTSAQFDEGGAKGLLLNTLSVCNDCRIVFDSWDVPGKSMNSGLTQNGDTMATINISFIKECIEQMMLGMQRRREISPSLQDILKLLDDPYRREAEAIAAMQNADETFDSSVDNPQSMDGEDAMDEVFDYANPESFECDQHAEGVFDEGSTHTSPYSASAGSIAPDRLDQEENLSYGEAEYQAEDESTDHTVDFLFLGMGIQSRSNAWAGPEHWKYRKVKDAHQSSEASNEISSKEAKMKKRKREPFSIDFMNPLEADKAIAFAPPKNQRSLLLPHNSSPVTTILPEDCHYQPEEFLKLFTQPSVMCIGKKGRKSSENPVKHGDSFEPSTSWGDEDGFASQWDSGHCHSDVEDSNDNMIAQPRKVQKIEVDYDKTSKQVDVHVLKRTLWACVQDFCRISEVGHEEKPETVISFKRLLSNLPADCPAAAPEDISVHLCFICILHLANEHCLAIRDCPSLDELCIHMPANCQK